MRVRAILPGIICAAVVGAQAPVKVHETVQAVTARARLEAAAPRRVILLEREEIARLPVRDVQELLAFVAGTGASFTGHYLAPLLGVPRATAS